MSEQEKKSALERRASKRIELITDVTYSVVMSSYQTGLIKDISEGGLCLLLIHQLPEGTVLNVEFNLQGGEQPEHIKALVRVIWQKLQEGKFLTGVKFLV